MPMKKMVRVHTTGQHIGGCGKCYKPLHGQGFLSSLKGFFKKTGRQFVNSAKTIAPVIAKELGPELLTMGAAKAAEYASQKGAPDFAVNMASQLAQRGAQQIRKSGAKDKEALSKNQRLVADFISDKSGDLLGQLLNRGSGVRGLGVRGLGVRGLGVRQLGNGLQAQEAPTIG